MLVFFLLAVMQPVNGELKSAIQNHEPDKIIGYKLQADGIMTNDSHVQYKGSLPKMSQFCLCFHAFQIRGRDPTVLFDYATEQANSEIIIIWRYWMEEIVFICCQGKILRYFKNVTGRRMEWHRFCVCADLLNNTLRLTFNGVTQYMNINNGTKSSTVYHINAGGDIYFGQYILNIDGTRKKDFSYSGILANFTITNVYEPIDVVAAFTTCRPVEFSGNVVIHMNDSKLFQKDNTTEKLALTYDDVCVPNKYIISYFSTPREPQEADQVCLSLGGRLAVPSSKQENKLLVEEAIKFSDHCGTLSWLGFQFNFEFHMPYDRRTKKLQSYNSFLPGLRLPRQDNCVTIDLKRNLNESWNVENCIREECYTCSFEARPTFMFRGLCENTKFDIHYTLYGYFDHKPAFIGSANSRIVWTTVPAWNNTEETWVVQYGDGTKTYGYIPIQNDFLFPVGLNEWVFVKDICESSDHPEKIMFTKCVHTQYACNNGECIEKNARCDQKLDCTDNSDELGCRMLDVPTGYDSRMPPPRTSEDNVTIVHQKIKIKTIHELDINKQTITIELQSVMYWFDSRLELRNLRDSYTSNFLAKDVNIWKPQLKFYGGEETRADSNILSSIVWAEKWSDKIPDSPSNIETENIFSGKTNPLFMSRTYKNTYVCHVDLGFYPFDVQTCTITDVNAHEPNIVSMVTDNVIYEGKNSLPEYEMIDISSTNTTWDIFNSHTITIRFRNMYRYYIFSTYIPTALMSVICYFTFWFDLDDFTNRIMVSLTALLVLTSLFSQIGVLVPKTSYVKMVDIWFLACISSNFLMIALQVVIAVIHGQIQFLRKKKEKFTSKKLNKYCKVWIPIVLFLISLAYFVNVFTLHY